MELKVVGNASLKRGFRFFRARKDQKNTNKDILEAIAKASDGGRRRAVVSCTEEDNGNGVVRMKIVVKKSDLKQLIEAMNGGGGGGDEEEEEPYRPSYSLSVVEQRLIMLRKKHIARANVAVKNNRNSRKCWSPMLQSIPEEFSA